MNRERNTTIIKESGLYELIFKSRKSEARNFKRWVKSEFLPSIRKHGAYMTSDVLAQSLNDSDFAMGLLGALKEEQEDLPKWFIYYIIYSEKMAFDTGLGPYSVI
jgi:anti-repressor protein